MKKILAGFVMGLVMFTNAFSQSPGVAINTDGATPHASAMLDVSSTAKGFLPPRMTNAQKTAIASPVAGLLIWCSNCGTSGELQIYNGTIWTNFVGGAASAGKPDAPTIGTATVSGVSGTATISFTAPASNGGSAITSYTATSSPGGLTTTLNQAGSGTITFTGLTNGTAYTFTVTATTVSGTGSPSAPSNSVTPCTVPGAPTIGTATAGNAQATVTFTAPASNGGSAITSYTATSTPGGFTGTISQAGSGTITITRLTIGTAYTFTVKANNTAGTGAASAASNSATPCNVPGAPTIGTATAGDSKATVTFTAPGSNGGSAITSYTATSSPGGFTGTLSQAGSGTISVTGLTVGTAYTFTVKANNAAGAGAASAASNSVTPYGVPGAPTIGTATAGDAKATVSFTQPASNGGTTITSYTATSTPGSFTGTLSQAGSGIITVTGLTNGTSYTFTVKATNAAGAGAESAASNSVSPIVPLITDGSGNLYNSVIIGTQTWLTTNLATRQYNDGTWISYLGSSSNAITYWTNATTAYYSVGPVTYSPTESDYLYNWFVVDNNAATKAASNGGKNVCPIGWHVPTDAEWYILVYYLGGYSLAGGKLKQTGTTYWNWPNSNATNSTGFTAYAGGIRSGTGAFSLIKESGVWWTTTDSNPSGISWQMQNTNGGAGRSSLAKTNGASIRCLKD